MASLNASNTPGVRRSRRLAGLEPNEGTSGTTSSSITRGEEVGGEDSDTDLSSDEGSSCQIALRYRSPGSMPVIGESYCGCLRKSMKSGNLDCKCGEEDVEYFEWHWDNSTKSQASQISEDGKTVRFHVDYSCGTAAVRGDKPMTSDQHFWEVKMTTPVYGTDMMVGVGTADVMLDSCRHMFCSLLGRDGDSWGLSYNGLIHHNGETRIYSTLFGQGSIIGIHLDMWHGTLSFYKNRQPLGLAYHGLQGKTLYPMVCSTAARSGMKVIKACSFSTSLQFLCCQVLRSYVPNHLSVTDSVMLPPGLKSFLLNNLSWLLRPVKQTFGSSKNVKQVEAPDQAGPSSWSSSSAAASPVLSRASFYRARFRENDRKRKAETIAAPAETQEQTCKGERQQTASQDTEKRDCEGDDTQKQRKLSSLIQSTTEKNVKSETVCDSGADFGRTQELSTGTCASSSSGEISQRRTATSERDDSSCSLEVKTENSEKLSESMKSVDMQSPDDHSLSDSENSNPPISDLKQSSCKGPDSDTDGEPAVKKRRLL